MRSKTYPFLFFSVEETCSPRETLDDRMNGFILPRTFRLFVWFGTVQWSILTVRHEL